MSAVGQDQILSALTEAVNGGAPVVLATIVTTEGSVPRHEGTKMVVNADGTSLGTVGGGKVEVEIRKDALRSLEQKRTELRHYTLQNPQRGDPGVCGGTMSVYLEGQDPDKIEHHYQWLYRSSHFMGSVVQGALSAIDIACVCR